jgi:hypothetical protein
MIGMQEQLNHAARQFQQTKNNQFKEVTFLFPHVVGTKKT